MKHPAPSGAVADGRELLGNLGLRMPLGAQQPRQARRLPVGLVLACILLHHRSPRCLGRVREVGRRAQGGAADLLGLEGVCGAAGDSFAFVLGEDGKQAYG